jgi:cardiolipin synthase (CMP-forming)
LAFWLFIAAAVSDGIDGIVARHFNQKTLLGEYLDPIADKLLLSSCFIVQALIGAIPLWTTVLVLSRDVVIIATVLVVVLTTDIRSFPPSRLGKINTAVQIATMFSVLTHNYLQMFWTERITDALILATAATVLLSSVDYALAVSRRLQRHHGHSPRS